jgi:phosphatidate cytidylyltransferase
VLKHRLLLGPVFIAAFIGLLWLDEWLDRQPCPTGLGWLCSDGTGTLPPALVLFLIGLVLVSIAARELGRIFHAGGVAASRRWMSIAAIAGLAVSAALPAELSSARSVALVASCGALVLIGSLLWHIRDRELHGATAAAGASMFAFVYLGLMFGFMLAIRREHSAWLLLSIVAITKSCDTAAYFTGKSIGRHKLILWISPGKTWEGLAGGVIGAALVAVLCSWLLRTYGDPSVPLAGTTWWLAAAFGGLLALAGQAGDLLASVLKRDAGIKDSGRIPGFGGVLDMIDSLLVVAPIAYWLIGSISGMKA